MEHNAQLQALQSILVDDLMTLIHNEFLGEITHQTSIVREEFLSMKCCSFKRKDLERHYNNMPKRFYLLKGMDDPKLKQDFLNSLLEPLGNEAFKLMETRRLALQNDFLGEIYQNTLLAFEKLCNQ